MIQNRRLQLGEYLRRAPLRTQPEFAQCLFDSFGFLHARVLADVTTGTHQQRPVDVEQDSADIGQSIKLRRYVGRKWTDRFGSTTDQLNQGGRGHCSRRTGRRRSACENWCKTDTAISGLN